MKNTTPASGSRRWLLRGGDELYRGVYTRAGLGRSGSVAICSAVAGDGKTTTSIGIALTLAQDYPERRIALIETDLLRPVIAEDFGLEPRPGLIECLVEQIPVRQIYRPTRFDNLRLIPAGGPTDEPERLLRSNRMGMILSEIRADFDSVIIDTPAMLSNSDAQLVTLMADWVLFVVRVGAASDEEVEQALAQIDRAKLRGVVMNASHSSVPRWLRRVFGI
jgi:capsular exopolysaccharide synthesis family protein